LRRVTALMQLARWCMAMGGPAEGRAFLSNLLFDCSRSRLPRSVVRSFCRAVCTSMQECGSSFSPHRTVEQVTDAAPSSYYCMGPRASTDALDCSRIMDARSLFAHNIDLTKARFFVTGHVSRQSIRMVEVLGLGGIARDFMRTTRPLAWVTQTEAIGELRDSTPRRSLANRVRDLAGLDHLWQDRHLVEIVYPSSVVASTPICAPTALDGGTALVYRSDSRPDGWGSAVDLQTLGRGLPEAVHPPVKFSDDFRVEYVGRIQPPRPAYDWGAFLQTLPVPWKITRFLELAKYV
jgi:hypothetical protein